jgi:DNA invertase Pin-like site-specific DNA recombinase
MSTDQQYSLENQSTAIQAYAESHGFEVVLTYSDAARSGLILRRRAGLRQLLQDVVAGTAPYKAILVYDVSRWGRFRTRTNRRTMNFSASQQAYPCIIALKRLRTMEVCRASS